MDTRLVYTRALVGLSSDSDGDQYFAMARCKLGAHYLVHSSPIYHSKDYTQTTQKIYANAVALLCADGIMLDELTKICTDLERQAGRTSRHITLDLDILALYDGKWHAIKKRVPFKHHEMVGLRALRASSMTVLAKSCHGVGA